MGRIKKWLEWFGAVLAALVTIATFGATQRRKGAKLGEEINRAEADRQGVQQERERTAGESTEDLYKDLTGGSR